MYSNRFNVICVVILVGLSNAAVIPSSSENSDSNPDPGILQPMKLIRHVLSSEKFLGYQKLHPSLQKDELVNSVLLRLNAADSKLRAYETDGKFQSGFNTAIRKQMVNADRDSVKLWVSKGGNFFDRLRKWWEATKIEKRNKRDSSQVYSSFEDATQLEELIQYIRENTDLNKFKDGQEYMYEIVWEIYQDDKVYLPKFVDWVVAQDEVTIREWLESLNKMLVWFLDWASTNGY